MADEEPQVLSRLPLLRPATLQWRKAFIVCAKLCPIFLLKPAISKAGLQVTGVSGFYSDWSPDIYTDHVKVLTGGDEHKVQIPENCAIIPPRLDNVYEAKLYFESTCKFVDETSDTSDEEDPTDDDEEPSEDEKERRPEPRESSYQVPSFEGLIAAVAKGTKLLSSLRIAAWMICLLLIVLILKH